MSRAAHVTWVVVGICASAAHAANVRAPTKPELRAAIPSQVLTAALANFVDQTGLQYGVAAGIDTDKLQSRLAEQKARPVLALTQMLRCTGLTFEFLTERAINIVKGGTPPEVDPECSEPDTVQTIVVRDKGVKVPIIELAVNVTVWPEGEYTSAGINGLSDLVAHTPGVEFDFLSSVGASIYNNLAIRGISDRHGSTAGIFIDGIPVPHVRTNNIGRALPSSFDLDQMEVHRGPQGTRLGADTQGGAVLFVNKEPDLVHDDANAGAEWLATKGADSGYELEAAAGGPLIDGLFGYRASIWSREEGGYVDRVNPFTGEVVDSNADSATSRGLHAALGWKPEDNLVIRPAIDYVLNDISDSRSFMTYLSDIDAGERRNGSLIPQPAHDEFWMPSLRIDYSQDSWALINTTAFFERNGNVKIDDTESKKWGWTVAAEDEDAPPIPTAYPRSYEDLVTTALELRQSMFYQELLFKSAAIDADPFLLGGLSYVRENYRESDQVSSPHTPPNVCKEIQLIDALYDCDLPWGASDVTTTVQTRFAVYWQYARRIATHFKLTAGVRVERDAYDSSSVAEPAFHAHHVETQMAPIFVLEYVRKDEGLYYLSANKGFSPAGVDPALPTCFAGPEPYPSDSVWSYELGWKQLTLKRKLHIDGSLFHATWSNGPDGMGNCMYMHMPGSAESNGFELLVKYESLNTRANLLAAYTDAHYTETIMDRAGHGVRDGDALGTPPLVISPWNLTASVEQDFKPASGATITLRAEDIYHSRNPGPFYTSNPESADRASGLAPDPAFNLLNLRGTYTRPNLEIAVYMNNALNTQPTLLKRNKGNDDSTLFYATTFRPRTLGLSLTSRF